MYSPTSLKIKNIISITDVFYKFRNGVAIIITGQNHDNPSQKSNGVGKSALIESLALAYTGTSIRDVKVKELINRQAKDGEVEFIQYNTITRHSMKIWRKFYSGTKSAECKIWIYNEQDTQLSQEEFDLKCQIKRADINDYNKFIFEEIGLSREDFFNFYLLVQANYSPFLRVGDTKKKEIINRFSGADSVDGLIPLVKSDCTLLTPVVEQLQKDLTDEEARYNVYQELIEGLELKNETLAETKKTQIEELEKSIATIDLSIKTKTDANVTNKKIVNDKDIEIKNLGKQKIVDQVTTDKAVLTKEKATLDQDNITKQASISKVQDSFKTQVDAIIKDETTAKTRLKTVGEELKEFEELESEINKHVQDTVECPKCKHKFSIRSEEFNHEEAVAQLPEIVKEIAVMKKEVETLNTTINVTILKRKQDVNALILAKQTEIRTLITANNTRLGAISTEIQTLTQKVTDVTTKETALNNTKNTAVNAIDFDTKSIATLTTQKNDLLADIEKTKLYTIDQEVADNELKKTNSKTHQDELKEQLDTANKDLMSVAQWETNFKNFKSFVANQSIENIQDYANLFLQQMGSDLTIKLDGFSELASGKMKEQISVDVLRGGFSEGSYGAFSGGERGRIDICVILAIQQLINLNCKSGGLDLLICDEILDQIDTLGLESIINSLQNLDRTIMIVSQNEINALKDYTLKIEKRNKISTFTT